MRVWLLLAGFLATFAVSISLAQQPDSKDSTHVVSAPDGGQSSVMESIFVPPKAGAPFSFTLFAEWTRTLSNGGTFTLTNERRILRDGRGRIYQERVALSPKGENTTKTVTVIQITDPENHTWYNCIVHTRICDLYYYRHSNTDKFVPARKSDTAHAPGSIREEDLGVSNTLGEDTHGYRETHTINPGTAANNQPMVSVREFWYSPRLALNLISTVDDPLSGHQVFTARDLSTYEPDPAIFEIPSGYTVVDHRAEKE